MRTGLILAGVAAALAASGASGAPASTATRTLASYCSPSGDVCYGVFARGGRVTLRISTAARYFGRYTLCVRAPSGALRCGSFPVFRAGAGTWSGTVRSTTFFPSRPGVHRATWSLGSSGPLGPSLRFRLRA